MFGHLILNMRKKSSINKKNHIFLKNHFINLTAKS